MRPFLVRLYLLAPTNLRSQLYNLDIDSNFIPEVTIDNCFFLAKIYAEGISLSFLPIAKYTAPSPKADVFEGIVHIRFITQKN